MSEFRKRILGILGSVISVSACMGMKERALREGLTEGSLCDEGGRVPRVTRLDPAEEQSYLEWRSGFAGEAGVADAWEDTKRPIVEDPSLSDSEKEALLDDGFDDVVLVEESTGSCDYPTCDRYVIPADGSGFFNYDYLEPKRYHLFAHGPGGPTLVSTEGALKAFLGTIDTPGEAAWLLSLEQHYVPCEADIFTEDESGYTFYTRSGGCGGDVIGRRLHVSRDGVIEELDSGVVERGDENCSTGRLPSGALSPACGPRATELTVGTYFAEAARLEGASIVAFLELARDLCHHGAPEELVAWAERAAVEETHHAEICRALARRYGADVSETAIEASPLKSLVDIALDNTVEGLCREAFGALVAHYQMLTATDPAVRAAMRIIARDEASHAEFSIALHRWIMTRLDANEHAAVTLAHQSAIRGLRSKLCGSSAPEVQRAAGLPAAEVASQLYDELFSVDFAA